MAEWQEGYVESNGIRLHYTRTGGDDKVPVVLAHGITDNGLCWSRFARELEDYCDFIMVDARGHGLSDKPESGYGPRDHAADLAGLIQALGLNKPLVIGHSMGAATASVLTAEYPGLVEAAVLEDPPWYWPLSPEEDAAKQRQNYELMRARIEERRALPAEELWKQGLVANPTWAPEEFDAWVLAKQQVVPQVAEFVLLNDRTWPQQVAAYSVPVVLIYGEPERGGLVSPAIAAEAKGINDLVLPRQIPGAGHNIRREQLVEFRASVREFLAYLRRNNSRE